MTPAVISAKSFERDCKKLSSQRNDSVIEALKLFLRNPKQSSLNFESVSGHKGYFTIRSTLKDRILLRKIDAQSYEAVAVGNHDYIYESYFRR